MDVEASAVLFEHSVVKLLAAETSDGHIGWFISDSLLRNLAWTLLSVSLVEWLGLIELLPVLRSVLIGVEILLSGPAGAVPKGRVHGVAGAIVEEGLSWAVQVLLILHVLVEFPGSFSRENLIGISVSEHAAGMSLGVNKTSSKGRLIRRVVGMVMRVSKGLSSGAISPGSCVQRIIGLRNEGLIESGGGHGGLWVVQSLLLENVSALLGESLLQMRISCNLGSVSRVAWEDMVLALNGFILRIGYGIVLTYSVGHIIVAGAVHVAVRPVEEV